MDYDHSDSSGTDDDLPTSHSGRVARSGRISGNGRATNGPAYSWMSPDQQIRKLEQDAYTAVLRAFIAQSEHITWAKEGLMSDLRKELRISDEQHREYLGKVSSDVTLRQIRELRTSGDDHSAQPMSASLMPDVVPSPAILASHKKQKPSHLSQAALSIPPPLSASKLAPTPSSVVSAKKSTPTSSRSKKSKNGRQQSATLGAPEGRVVPGGTSRGTAEVPMDPWIGRRVKTRWPEDNTFYEAVITDYDPEKGLHALTYGMNTEEEAWEWVNLRELSPRDLKWVDAPPIEIIPKGPCVGGPGITRSGAGRVTRKGSGRAGLLSPPSGVKAVSKGPTNSFEKLTTPIGGSRPWRASGPSEKILYINGSRQIRLSPLECLVKEVDRVTEEDDLAKLESTKKVAKEREEMIRDALAEIGESSDGESAPLWGKYFRNLEMLRRTKDYKGRDHNRPHPPELSVAMREHLQGLNLRFGCFERGHNIAIIITIII